MKIAIFYHCLFFHGQPTPRPTAVRIVREQMQALQASGLLQAADLMVVGLNGSCVPGIIPEKAIVVMHGNASFAENLTIIEIENWSPVHPGWAVLYFHPKGATHDESTPYGSFCARWRRCMMRQCVTNWRVAVSHLANGFDAAGCHWVTGMGSDKSQQYFAGNFWWATSDFLATVPSMLLRDRIKMSGIAAAESRFEAEVWIGNGKRRPKVKEMAPGHPLWYCP